MAKARIFKPAKTATQSGMAKTKQWVLEYEPETPLTRSPEIGWVATKDMRRGVHLKFTTQADAIEYANQKGIVYELLPEEQPAIPHKSYANNFRFDRRL